MKPKPENAKDPRWMPPVELPGVSPGDYPEAHTSAAALAGKGRPDTGPPDYTLPGHPSHAATAKPKKYLKF